MLIYLPTYDMIMGLHDAIIEISGGKPGMLHPEVVDAAIHRPKTYLSYHEDCTLHTVCAVLMDSIARNHGFSDGNKRTGLMTAILTYELNGIALNMYADKTDEFENLVLWVVNEKPEIPDIAARLEALTNKYKKGAVNKVIDRLKSLLEPFDS
jgi:death-on-curing family protein